MINRATWARFDAVIAQYRHVIDGHPSALEQIVLAERAESVQQSNAIENSTLALDKAKRQTIPAFCMRDRWMIAEEFR